jgi:hypothetical protein
MKSWMPPLHFDAMEYLTDKYLDGRVCIEIPAAIITSKRVKDVRLDGGEALHAASWATIRPTTRRGTQ